jgi:hypothetical protein
MFPELSQSAGAHSRDAVHVPNGAAPLRYAGTKVTCVEYPCVLDEATQ